MHESFFKDFIKSLTEMCSNIYAFICGYLATIIGYFVPVRDIVHLLILFFIIDVGVGYTAAKKLRNERFSVKIIWAHTIPRMLISLVLIIGAYMWDKVYEQEVLSTYKVIGWFISGVLLYSIAENGYYITKWSVFQKIGNLFRGKIKDSTGLDVKDEANTPNANE